MVRLLVAVRANSGRIINRVLPAVSQWIPVVHFQVGMPFLGEEWRRLFTQLTNPGCSFQRMGYDIRISFEGIGYGLDLGRVFWGFSQPLVSRFVIIQQGLRNGIAKIALVFFFDKALLQRQKGQRVDITIASGNRTRFQRFAAEGLLGKNPAVCCGSK